MSVDVVTEIEIARPRAEVAAFAADPSHVTDWYAQIRSVESVKSQTGARRVPGTGGKRFAAESWAELKKVEWPTQAQVIQGTVVVLIACIIVGVYLYAADQVFKRLVQHIFLR